MLVVIHIYMILKNIIDMEVILPKDIVVGVGGHGLVFGEK